MKAFMPQLIAIPMLQLGSPLPRIKGMAGRKTYINKDD
jgi:hypothetical protein